MSKITRKGTSATAAAVQHYFSAGFPMPQFLARGDICISTPPFAAGSYVILEVDLSQPAYVYLALNLVNLKRYRFGEEGLKKVGVANEEFLNSVSQSVPAADLKFDRCRLRAKRSAEFAL